MPFREFAVDSIITSHIGNWSKGTINFWLMVKSLKTPMGDVKYPNLSILVLPFLLAMQTVNEFSV